MKTGFGPLPDPTTVSEEYDYWVVPKSATQKTKQYKRIGSGVESAWQLVNRDVHEETDAIVITGGTEVISFSDITKHLTTDYRSVFLSALLD